ncbi:hypothetical protein NFI96_026804, partial [Prochilodus magdalenae]
MSWVTPSDVHKEHKSSTFALAAQSSVPVHSHGGETGNVHVGIGNVAVFKGLGQFPGEHNIHVDPDVPPVIHGCRKIPLAVMDRLKDTLDELLEAEVIARVTEPTAWVNSLVVTEKRNGALRVCLDPRDLNKAVLRQHFSIPTTEDVLCKLADKKVFSILDEKDGYWQVKLDKESSMLCTFNTPWGRYRFKRLPFGIKSASEVFQQHNCETFGDIEGVHIVADDMIIAATSEQQHDKVMSKVMEQAVNVGIKFNPDKIQYKVNTVRFMGHVVTPDGVKADESKVQAISDMPTPTDKQALQRLLGMIKYLAQFIPLTDTEKNYAQIEKELLAIVYSVKKFHQYVYGVNVKVQTDHRPLESILR